VERFPELRPLTSDGTLRLYLLAGLGR